MEIKNEIPIVLFDDQCYVCIKFATIVNFLAKGKITMVGHYSNFGIKIRGEILDESALEMFWFIDEKRASGGRAALFPLVKSIFLLFLMSVNDLTNTALALLQSSLQMLFI